MIEIERDEKPVEPLGPEAAPRYAWTVRGRPEIGGISREPLLSACRLLKSLGAATDETVAVFRPGHAEWDMRTTVGYGSSITVEESQKVSPRFKPYREFHDR